MAQDLEMHKKCSQPHESKEAAEKANQDFYEEVCKLREKYQIAEFVFACGSNHGIDKTSILSGYRGGKMINHLITGLLLKTRLGSALVLVVAELDKYANIHCSGEEESVK